uniref:Uncharacterized protein n=1 Tax=Romanomermis culicivorax TaxID=13658 RepID=A0A915L4B1_ROMCU
MFTLSTAANRIKKLHSLESYMKTLKSALFEDPLAELTDDKAVSSIFGQWARFSFDLRVMSPTVKFSSFSNPDSPSNFKTADDVAAAATLDNSIMELLSKNSTKNEQCKQIRKITAVSSCDDYVAVPRSAGDYCGNA